MSCRVALENLLVSKIDQNDGCKAADSLNALLTLDIIATSKLGLPSPTKRKTWSKTFKLFQHDEPTASTEICLLRNASSSSMMFRSCSLTPCIWYSKEGFCCLDVNSLRYPTMIRCCSWRAATWSWNTFWSRPTFCRLGKEDIGNGGVVVFVCVGF